MNLCVSATCGFAVKTGVSMSSELDVSSKRKAAETQTHQRQFHHDETVVLT
jgi:hypothetical protein